MANGGENHFPRMDELTAVQKQKIAEVRKNCEDVSWRYPEYLTDFTILRWLMGWDYDMLSFRKLVMPLRRCLGGIMCQDREGNVVYVHAIGRISPKSLVKGGPTSMLFKSCIIEAEASIRLVREAEEKHKRKLGCKVIVDMEGFSMDLVYMPAVKIYMSLVTLLQELFADFGRYVYIINQPSVMSAAYAVISPILSKQLRDKIRFLGNDWKEIICNDLGPENVYPQWGGTKPLGRPETYLRMGGEMGIFWVHMDGKRGRQFKWLFRVSSNDIDFSIVFDERIIYPVFRCTTEFHPEMDSLVCEWDGLYTFVFSNEHGMVFGKEIKYYIELM